jgi:hypothetical protein
MAQMVHQACRISKDLLGQLKISEVALSLNSAIKITVSASRDLFTLGKALFF